MFVEQLTGIIVAYGKVKILMMLLNMSDIHQRSMCSVLWWKAMLMVLSFCKNLQWLVTFFYNFVSCPCGIVLHIDGAPPHFTSSCFSGQVFSWSLDRKWGPFPGPLTLHIWLLDFFFWGFLKDFFLWKSARFERVTWQNHQSCRVHYQRNSDIWRETEYCLRVCHTTADTHIEIFWALWGPVFKNACFQIHFMVEDM